MNRVHIKAKLNAFYEHWKFSIYCHLINELQKYVIRTSFITILFGFNVKTLNTEMKWRKYFRLVIETFHSVSQERRRRFSAF